MENKNNSDKDLPKRTTDQKNATEAERRFLAESKILIIEATSKEEGEDKEEEEERSSIKGTNSFRKEAMKENNGMLKGTTASESFSGRIDNTERSVQERKRDTVTKITIAEQFNETRSLPGEFSSDGSKREINNPRKMGDMATTDRHRCQRPLRDIIGKREQRREELEKVEGDLRQRLDMLECSMPAVMVWNTWRMSQGAPACRIKHILEKQFKDTGELSCRSTPSCHYDCRVREVEAERKLALKKVEDARTLWSQKLATLEERKRKLGEARKIQEEQRNAIERLNEESRVLRETREKKPMEMEELCQCGDTQCKQRHLSRVSSVTSVESGDIKCLEKLQRLAEEEVITKREIAELERREEAYMTTLQKADELWSKMEGDVVSTTNGLQEQLDMKIAANQQLANRVCELEDTLEKCRTRLATCTAELEKFLSIEKVEATIGRDDDVAKVVDKKVAVRAKVVHRPIGRVDDIATVKDDEVLAKVEVADGEALATVAVTDADVETAFVGDDKFVSVRPDLADLAVDRPVDLVQIEDAESVVRPEDLDHEQLKFKEVQKYLTKLGSLEELYKDDGEPCAPDFVCNDVVTSPTGMTDEELIALGVKQPAPTKERDKTVSDEEERKRQFQKELDTADAVIDKKEKREDEIPGVEIEKRVVEKVEKRVAPEIMVDVSVRETVTPRTIKEEAADDRLVTMPKTRAPEIEANRDVVIQRDTVLSWIDAIDTIRTTAAKHPECREVEKDADILAEQVGTYVGIKPKEVKEKNATIITEAKKMEPETKIEFAPFPDSEETRAEIKAPTEAIAESELLPTLTKEEVPIGMEPPTAVSMDDSFQPPTIHDKKDLKDDTIPLAVPEPHKPDIEKIKTEETRVDEIVRNAKEIEVPKYKNAEKDVAVEDLINNKLTVILEENDKTVNSIDKKEILVVPKIEKKEQEIISNHIERDEKKEKDMLIETIVEDEKVDKVLPVTEIEEREFVEQIVGESKEISQQDETKMADIKEMIPHMEIIRTNEIAEVPAVAEMEEVEQDAEKTTLAVDMEEIKQIIPETILPTVDITEVEKFEPEKFPIVDIEKAPNAVEEKIKIEEPTPILDVKEEPLLLDAVIEKKVEIEKPVLIKEEIEVAELLPVAKMAEREEIVIAELPPIEDVEKKEKIEAIELPPISDTVREEKIEAVESIPLADAVTKEKIEIIEVAELLPVAKIAEREIVIAELPPIEDVEKKEKIEAIELPPILDIVREEKIEAVESIPLADAVTEEKIEIIEVAELLPVAKIAEREEIVIAELPPIEDVEKKEKIEAIELPPILDTVREEKIEAVESIPLTDAVTEEKIEIIQPIPPLPIKREMEKEEEKEEEIEAAEVSVHEVEIKKEKDKEIKEVTLPEEVTPSVELPEKMEEKEVKKTEILAEVAPPKEVIVKDKKEVPVEEKKPEMVQIELKIPIAEIKSTEIPVISLDPAELVVQPYLIIAKLKQKELLPKPPCVECYLRPPIEMARPSEIPQINVLQTEIVQAEVIQSEVVQTKIVQNEIVQTEVVQTEAIQTEVIQITTQTVSTTEPPRMPPIRIISSEYLKPAELKASRTEIAGDRPEITGRKMLWHKRLKDQSTVTTASTGSQTDKTSHVSHDRVVRDERERARVPTDELLRSIKIAAAGLARPDVEREIRTINYGGKSEEVGRVACNCCLCGRTSTPTPPAPSTGLRLEVQPQIDAKTATPPAAIAFKRMFIRPKIDHPIPHDRLCPDCKIKIQSKMPRERDHLEKIIKKISRDQDSCDCTSLIGKSCRAVPRKRVIEKRDQACLAKIPKRKTNPGEHKRKNDLQSILEDSEKLTVEPLSPSCFCFKLEKTGVEPIRKGNCYCAD